MTRRYDHQPDMTAAQRLNGTGLQSSWRCFGCGQPRYSLLGSRGQGIRKRCRICVEKKAGA